MSDLQLIYMLQENMLISFTWKFVKKISVSLLYIVTTMYIKESGERISDMECLLYMCCLWDRI